MNPTARISSNSLRDKMKVTRFLALGVLLALAACTKPAATDKPAAAAATPATPPLVTVNGKAISPELFEDYVQAVARQPSSALSAEDREQIKDNLVRMELIAQQAEKDGLAKTPDVANRLDLARLNILQQASAQQYLKDRKPSDAELRAEFETQLASTPLVEYQARHILVASEDIAQKIIQQLQGGADFASLAKKLSTDKESAKNGGDLGWFPPNRMVKPFADAVALLKKGEYTKTPVQSQFGFHVIQLINTRDRPPPAFDDVKEQLTQILLSKKYKAYSDEMLKTAKIEPPLAGAPAAPAASSAPAPASN
jgi:peptidyl-prolyl cis-trans isomerase C